MALGRAKVRRDRRLAVVGRAAWLVSLTACGDTGAPAPPVDAGSEVVAEAGLDAPLGDEIPVGLGEGGAPFTRLGEGATLLLERGSQGLQHVYFSVSAELPAGFHAVSHAFSTSASPAPPYLLGPSQLSVPFVTGDDSPAGTTLAFGILAVVPVPEPLLEAEPLYLHVRVDARDGTGAGRVSRAVRVAWP